MEVQRAWRQKQDALQRKRQNRSMGQGGGRHISTIGAFRQAFLAFIPKLLGFHMGGSIFMGDPQNGGFIRENPIRKDDLGVPLFQETSI